jgi:hypothetical protein
MRGDDSSVIISGVDVRGAFKGDADDEGTDERLVDRGAAELRVENGEDCS